MDRLPFTSPPMAASPVISNDVIAEEILPKLPIESLVRFQFASKYWRSEIRDRFFSQTSSFIVVLYSVFNPAQPSSYSVFLHNNFRDNLALLPPAFSSPSFGRQMLLRDSCSGLLLYDSIWLGMLVYNPTTKQSIQLPRAPPSVRLIHAEIGFDPQSSPPQFKVARVFRRWSSLTSSSSIVLQLFSSCTNNWLEFETSADFTRHRFHGRKFVFTETSVFVDVQNANSFLLRFDFQEERFRRIELPQRSNKRPFRSGTLGKCNGSIFYAEKCMHLFKVWKLETRRSYGWIPMYEQSYDIFPAEQLPKCQNPLIRFIPDSEGMLVAMGKNIYSYNFSSNALVQLHVVEEDAGICRVFPFSLCPIYIPMGTSS